jgi:hypothetical protein
MNNRGNTSDLAKGPEIKGFLPFQALYCRRGKSPYF